MVDQRQPGDVSVKTRTRTVNYMFHKEGNTDTERTATWNEFRSERPYYGKGAVISLPGGGTFQKSTSYVHESWEVGDFQPATAGPGIYSGKQYFAEDFGREGTVFITRYPGFREVNIPVDARNEAATKALNKIADQKINLGENLATLHQTVKLFADKSELLLKLYQMGLRKKEWRRYFYQSFRDLHRKGPLTVAASEYLAYVYGLKPLMQDVYEAHKMIQHHAGKTLLLKATGTAQRTENKADFSYGVNSYTSVRGRNWSSNSKTKCTIWARIDPNYKGLRALNQLGLLNPLGLAWDLVPFSFCVDWFLPVGPVLYALTAPAGLIFVDGSISFRNSENLEVVYDIAASTWNKKTLKAGESAIVPITYEGFKRSPLTNWPIPGLWIDSDPFRGDRPLKALALMIMALSGSKPPIR